VIVGRVRPGPDPEGIEHTSEEAAALAARIRHALDAQTRAAFLRPPIGSHPAVYQDPHAPLRLNRVAAFPADDDAFRQGARAVSPSFYLLRIM
jgi:hypothetical protein